MIHLVRYILGGLFLTACGRYVSGPGVTAFPHEATCKVCRNASS